LTDATIGGIRRELSLWNLVCFHVTAILSLRWISVAAARGQEVWWLWLLAWLAFFVPAALVVLDLSRRMPQQGGLYRWTTAAFGPAHGFFCAWCYVISNVVFFPALLVTVADYGRLALGGQKADPAVTQVVALTCLWLIVGLNLFGLRAGKRFQTAGAVALWIPSALLLGLGLVALASGGFAVAALGTTPAPSHALADWRLWASLCFAFGGVELVSSMAEEVRNPRRDLPRSIHMAGAIVTLVYVLGTLSVLAVIPGNQVVPTAGVLQGLDALVSRAGLPFVTPVLAGLLALGALAMVNVWLAGSARLPYAMGIDRHLPAAFLRLGSGGAPTTALLSLGGLCTVVTLVFFAGSSVQAAYGILNDATTLLYFVPFLYLFGAAVRLGGRTIVKVAAVVGFTTTAAVLVLTAIPPPDATSPWSVLLRVAGGATALGGISWLVKR
jgi:amino acid transporter